MTPEVLRHWQALVNSCMSDQRSIDVGSTVMRSVILAINMELRWRGVVPDEIPVDSSEKP